MLGTRLFSLINTFSKKEIKEFGLYVSSPFFTSGKNYPTEKLIKLVNIIIDTYPDLESVKLEKKRIYISLYGNKPYNDNTLRNLFSDLKELAEGYMKACQIKHNDFEQEHYLLIELFNRKLDKEFLKQLDKCYKSLEDKELNSEYFYNRFRTTDYFSYFNGRKQNINYNEIQDAYNDFNRFYILRALQQFILMVNLGNLMKFQFKIPMFDEVMNHVENNLNEYEKIPRIIIYYNLIRMLSAKDEKYFFELKNKISKLENSLDIIDRNNIYICLGNYCLEEIIKGNMKYHREKFEIDNAYLASGLIYDKHFFHLNLFMGMSMNALDLGKYQWTEDFINTNIAHVAPEMRVFAKNYLMAEINYRIGNLEKALKYLAVITIENPYNKQLIRNLTMKILYDKGYQNEALALAETSLKFLKGLDEKDFKGRDDFWLFVKYYLALIKLQIKALTPKQIIEEKELMIKDLDKERYFRNKNWLTEKLKI